MIVKNNIKYYGIQETLQIIAQYIYHKKDILVSIRFNMHDEKEKSLFEKAATVALNWFEEEYNYNMT